MNKQKIEKLFSPSTNEQQIQIYQLSNRLALLRSQYLRLISVPIAILAAHLLIYFLLIREGGLFNSFLEVFDRSIRNIVSSYLDEERVKAIVEEMQRLSFDRCCLRVNYFERTASFRGKTIQEKLQQCIAVLEGLASKKNISGIDSDLDKMREAMNYNSYFVESLSVSLWNPIKFVLILLTMEGLINPVLGYFFKPKSKKIYFGSEANREIKILSDRINLEKKNEKYILISCLAHISFLFIVALLKSIAGRRLSSESNTFFIAVVINLFCYIWNCISEQWKKWRISKETDNKSAKINKMFKNVFSFDITCSKGLTDETTFFSIELKGTSKENKQLIYSLSETFKALGLKGLFSFTSVAISSVQLDRINPDIFQKVLQNKYSEISNFDALRSTVKSSMSVLKNLPLSWSFRQIIENGKEYLIFVFVLHLSIENSEIRTFKRIEIEGNQYQLKLPRSSLSELTTFNEILKNALESSILETYHFHPKQYYNSPTSKKHKIHRRKSPAKINQIMAAEGLQNSYNEMIRLIWGEKYFYNPQSNSNVYPIINAPMANAWFVCLGFSISDLKRACKNSGIADELYNAITNIMKAPKLVSKKNEQGMKFVQENEKKMLLRRVVSLSQNVKNKSPAMKLKMLGKFGGVRLFSGPPKKSTNNALLYVFNEISFSHA